MMQDYGDPRGFPPVGEGAWPDGVVRLIAILLLILAVMVCYAAYRAGRRYERQRLEVAASKAPEIIFFAVRRQIDIALMATGERAFGPVRSLIETIDAYLGPVLRLTEGHNALAVTINKLKKALATEKKKVLVEDNHGHGHGQSHGGGHGQGHGGSTVIITSGPPVGASGQGASASASAGVAAAAAVGPGGGVQVVEPARIYEIPAHDPHHHPPHKPAEKEVELTARERAQILREALEHLSDYWQKERVEGELRAAQEALTITRPIGDRLLAPPARPRPPGAPPPPANPVAKAARDANSGRFPLFKF